MDTSSLDRSMRLSVAEGGLATAMGSLFSGVFLTGFALSMGASPLQIGVLFALPSLCSLAQLLGSYWIERHGGCRRLCLVATATSRLLYLPVLLVPLLGLGLSLPARVWCIVGLMAISGTLSSIGGVSWLTWTKALVPSAVRIPFFCRRNMVSTALSFLACLACGLAIDFWAVDEDRKLIGFVAVFGVAMACGLVGFGLLSRIPDVPILSRPKQKSEPFARTLAAPLVEPNFRRVVLFFTAWNVAVNVAAPFYSVFFLQRLGLPIAYIILLNTVNTLAGLAANKFWARLGQRFGLKPIVLLAAIGDALYPLLLVFVDVQWTWVLLLIHLTGVFSTPLAIGADNFILKLQPDRGGSAYAAVFRAVVGPASAVAATLGGWLAGAISDGGMAALGMIDGLAVIFLISFVGRLASLFLLAGVAEPEARSARHILRVVQRRMRLSLAGRVAASRGTWPPAPHLSPNAVSAPASRVAPYNPDGATPLPTPIPPGISLPVQTPPITVPAQS